MQTRPAGWQRNDTLTRAVPASVCGCCSTQADCLIAAAAIGVGARLATGNPKHFPMPELDVEHWLVGE
jgi:hypothetical protein